MGIRITNYDAFTNTSSVAIGVSIPFNSYLGSGSLFNQTYTTEVQLKSNIINFILTERGERPLNLNFGSSLSKYIFGNITTDSLQTLEMSLLNDLKIQFPEGIYNIKFTSVKANPNYDYNTINIVIDYNFFGRPQSININT